MKNGIKMIEREIKYKTENWANNKGIITEFIINKKTNEQKINNKELRYKKDIKGKFGISSPQKITNDSNEKKIKLVKETISKSKNQKAIKNNIFIENIIKTIEFLLKILFYFPIIYFSETIFRLLNILNILINVILSTLFYNFLNMI